MVKELFGSCWSELLSTDEERVGQLPDQNAFGSKDRFIEQKLSKKMMFINFSGWCVSGLHRWLSST